MPLLEGLSSTLVFSFDFPKTLDIVWLQLAKEKDINVFSSCNILATQQVACVQLVFVFTINQPEFSHMVN